MINDSGYILKVFLFGVAFQLDVTLHMHAVLYSDTL